MSAVVTRASAIAAILIALVTAGAWADDVSMDTDAIDQVGTAYTTGGQVLLLGLKGGDASISTRAVYAATVPGARAEKSLYDSSDFSGYLRYSVYGHSTCKITVVTETPGYNSGSLIVGCYAIYNFGGSAQLTLGTTVHETTPVYTSYGGNGAQDLITGISGVNTWTGTQDQSGASIAYGLFSPPGVSQVDVLYTILEVGE
jgi:hypothetical protein